MTQSMEFKNLFALQNAINEEGYVCHIENSEEIHIYGQVWRDTDPILLAFKLHFAITKSNYTYTTETYFGLHPDDGVQVVCKIVRKSFWQRLKNVF